MSESGDKESIKYKQIERDLLGMIQEGTLCIGSQVQPEHEISKRYSVSRFTARKALGNLEQRGYLTRTPGRGTFVADWKRSGISKPGTSTVRKDLATIFINNDTDNLWNMRLLQAMSSAAEEMGYHLTFCATRSQDLEQQIVPLAVKEGSVRGAIINGELTENQARCLKQYPLKYLFAGNVEKTYGIPAVSYDFEDMAFEISSALMGTRKGPVWMIIEPFRLFYTHQIARGYQSALLKHSESPNLLFGCKPLDCAAIVERMVKNGSSHNCIITMPSYVQGLLDHMNRANINIARDITMVVIGQREPWWHYDEELILCDIKPELCAIEAVKQMKIAVENEIPCSGKNFKFKLDAASIENKAWSYSWT